MKRFQTALVAAMLCIGCLQPLAAQAANYPYSLSVTPFAGGYVFEGNQRLHNTPVYGLAIGYNLSEHWALEGVASFSTDVTSDKSNNEDLRVFGLRGDILYHFLPEGPLVPYLAIGGGYLGLEPRKGETDDDLMVNYGAGLKFFLTDSVALRADVRHILDINVNDIGSHPSYYNNLSYTAGLTFQLGGAPPPVRPVAKAEPAPAVTTLPPASVPPAKIAEKKMEQAPCGPEASGNATCPGQAGYGATRGVPSRASGCATRAAPCKETPLHLCRSRRSHSPCRPKGPVRCRLVKSS